MGFIWPFWRSPAWTAMWLCYPVRLWLVWQCITFYLLSLVPRLVFLSTLHSSRHGTLKKYQHTALSQHLLLREIGIRYKTVFLCPSCKFGIHWGYFSGPLHSSQPTFCLGGLLHSHDWNHWGLLDLHPRLRSWVPEPDPNEHHYSDALQVFKHNMSTCPKLK